MNLIVAVDENWGIGYKGDLLERISEDLKNFKEKTIGKTIVMGRVTFDSLPNKKALPKRENIILTKQHNLKIEACKVYNNIEDILNLENKDDVFIIGGENIYQQFLPYCKKAYVTKIFNSYEHDRSFPNLDEKEYWLLTEKSEVLENKNGVKFQFTIYENTNIIQ